MTSELILFLILALVAVGSAIGMLLSRNAVYSALFLIMNFITIAVFFLLLGGPFLAMVQITVYAGAIMVLFLFVIMLLGAEKLGTGPGLPWQRPLAIILGLALILETVYVLLSQGEALPELGVSAAEFGSPSAIGDILFNRYLIPFEVTSVLLLIAMIGAIILTRGVSRK